MQRSIRLAVRPIARQMADMFNVLKCRLVCQTSMSVHTVDDYRYMSHRDRSRPGKFVGRDEARLVQAVVVPVVGEIRERLAIADAQVMNRSTGPFAVHKRLLCWYSSSSALLLPPKNQNLVPEAALARASPYEAWHLFKRASDITMEKSIYFRRRPPRIQRGPSGKLMRRDARRGRIHRTEYLDALFKLRLRDSLCASVSVITDTILLDYSPGPTTWPRQGARRCHRYTDGAARTSETQRRQYKPPSYPRACTNRGRL